MKHARTIAVSLALLVGACETLPGAATPGPTGPAAIPTAPISLGDWRNASEAATLEAFQQGVAGRYGAGLPVAEYAPNQVKKAVIGVGHGEKAQIHMMVKVLLPKAQFDSHDAADALAIAICHAHNRQGLSGRLAKLAG